MLDISLYSNDSGEHCIVLNIPIDELLTIFV